jgi:uracil-DNA glycosylase
MAQQLSMFERAATQPDAAGAVVDWAGRLASDTVAPDWQPLLHSFWASATGQQLMAFVQQRAQAGATIYPPHPLRALQLTPLSQVRVVILGQDPYHGPGQAEGLAFSVPAGQRLPPSLRNMFKEILREQGQPATAMPASGSLLHWAEQGVLLLNTTLTVEDGQPASHAKQGWEALTDHIIAACSAMPHPVAFLLWGAHAQAKAGLIDASRHLLLQANHPSPLSATRGPLPFIGCGHFGQVNRWLAQRSDKNIQWLEESHKTVA